MVKWPISTESFVVSEKELFRSLILSFPSEIDYTITIDSIRIPLGKYHRKKLYGKTVVDPKSWIQRQPT
jgi:hypothetical protein